MPVTATRSRPAPSTRSSSHASATRRGVSARSPASRTSPGSPSASRKRATASSAEVGEGPRRARRSGLTATLPPVRDAAARDLPESHLREPRETRRERLPDPAGDVLRRGILEHVVQVAVIHPREHVLLHDALHVAEVGDHAAPRVDLALDRHDESVVVAMEPEAGPLVAREPVRRREVELDVESHAPPVDVVDRRHAPLIVEAGGSYRRLRPMLRHHRCRARAGCGAVHASFAPVAAPEHLGATDAAGRRRLYHGAAERAEHRFTTPVSQPHRVGTEVPTAARTPFPHSDLSGARARHEKASPWSPSPGGTEGGSLRGGFP